jgi:hypothetical protein
MTVVGERIWTGENAAYPSASFMDVIPRGDVRKFLGMGFKNGAKGSRTKSQTYEHNYESPQA